MKVVFTVVKQFKQLQRKLNGIVASLLKPLNFFWASLQLLKLLHNCKDHFHFYSLSAVHMYDLYHMHIISLLLLLLLFTFWLLQTFNYEHAWYIVVNIVQYSVQVVCLGSTSVLQLCNTFSFSRFSSSCRLVLKLNQYIKATTFQRMDLDR